MTPTFFINGRRYDGPWDTVSLSEALLGSLGHRVHSAAVDFASWAPSTGVMLLAMSILAVLIVNSPLGPAFSAFWEAPLGIEFADARFRMPLAHWVNDGLLTIFFLLVGLEIKREFTVGRLANRRLAAFPIAAALGGMAVPAALYALVIPAGAWAHGWGIPMATDTAFAVALIVMLGTRVPVELRVFLTAASIVDDIGAIVVVALFYSGTLHWGYLGGGGGDRLCARAPQPLGRLSRRAVCPSRHRALGMRARGRPARDARRRAPCTLHPDAAAAESECADGAGERRAHRRDGTRRGRVAARPVGARAARARRDPRSARIACGRTLRAIEPWSSYVVLPVFALGNAGVALSLGVFAGHEPLIAAIVVGLVVGKPLGFMLAPALAVRAGIAVKPASYSWRQLLGAGTLAGIGFTMSLFIAGQAMPIANDFAAAKIAVFAASIVAACLGVALLWRPWQPPEGEADDPGTPYGHTPTGAG